MLIEKLVMQKMGSPAEVAAATSMSPGAEVGNNVYPPLPMVRNVHVDILGTQGEEMAASQLVLLHDLGFSSWLVALSSDTLGFPIPFKIKCLF